MKEGLAYPGASHFDPEKGLEELIKAWDEAWERGDDKLADLIQADIDHIILRTPPEAYDTNL